MSPSSVMVLMMNGAMGVRANTVGVMAASQVSRSARNASCCSAWVTTTRSRSLHASAVPEPIEPPTCTPSPSGRRRAPRRRGRRAPWKRGSTTSKPPIGSVAVAGELVAAVAGAVLVGAGEHVGDLRDELVEVERAHEEASAPDWKENVRFFGLAAHSTTRAVLTRRSSWLRIDVEHLEARADAARVEVEHDAPRQLVGDAAGGLVGAGGADGVGSPCVPTMRTSISQAAGSSFTTSTFGRRPALDAVPAALPSAAPAPSAQSSSVCSSGAAPAASAASRAASTCIEMSATCTVSSAPAPFTPSSSMM